MWRWGRFFRGMGLYLFCAGLLCAALCSCSAFQSTCTTPAVTNIPPPRPAAPKNNGPYSTVDFNMPLSQITNPTIYVLKAKRRLLVIQGKTLVREFPCALGPHPVGNKYFQGDGRTPMGKFEICDKNPHSHFFKSLGINYPTIPDARHALSAGIISFGQYCSIKDADESLRLPPSDTILGGQVFIHGGGCAPDWTLGCIAVNNSAMAQLFEVARRGTPVYILP